MHQELFETLVSGLFGEDGQKYARRLAGEGGAVGDFFNTVSNGVARAQQVELIFGRGKRYWEITCDREGGTVDFARMEYHEVPSATWDRMGESFTVAYPDLGEKEVE